MKKYIIFFSIVSLIITTSIVKSSTRQLEKNIFTLEEEVKILEEKFNFLILENDYLTTPERLIRLKDNSPKQKILDIQSKIGYINNNNKTLILNKFKIFSQKLYLLNKILNTSSIEKNLKKGYAILKSENQIIKSIQTLKKLNNFDVTLKDGVMSVKKKL